MRRLLKKIDWLRCVHQMCRAGFLAARRARFQYQSNRGGTSYRLRGKYLFKNRSRNCEAVLIVLAGFKPQLWDDVFSRVKRYTPNSIDICVITSGSAIPDLDGLCERNGWSYLATDRNCLTLSQNIAINLHPAAETIYKMDEDIFLTDGALQKMKDACALADNRRFEVGMVAPLLNVNGYGYVKILEKLGKVADWENAFGPLFYTEGIYAHQDIVRNPAAAKFMWSLMSIDEMNSLFASQPPAYSISPYRFSIGLIMFSRRIWLDMGMFDVTETGCDLGNDEEQICIYCLMHSKAKVICENAVVGHLAFGPQTKEMLVFHAEGHCR